MAGKYKGTDPHAPRAGLNRLRRANLKTAGRTGGWERWADDDQAMEQHGARGKTSHFAENVLARFNRLARGADAAPGEAGDVCGFAGSQVVVRGGDGREVTCVLRRTLLTRIGGVRNPLAVGDRVRWLPDERAVTAVEPRRSVLARADSHNKALVHVLCANLDLVVVVAALDQPAFKPGFVDRALVLAAASGIDALLVLTKADLADAAAAAALYRSLAVPVFVSGLGRDGDLPTLRDRLAGRTLCVAGQSGVGKSTLLNACFGLDLRTGMVDGDGLGRHTTTSARSVPAPGGGRIIDTPGIRECALHGLTLTDVGLLMADLAAHRAGCRFADCSHRHEPGCAVRAAVDAGAIARSRYASYRSIVDEDLAS